MYVKFWGTRGSLPKSGPGTVRYGGNTSCVEARSERGTLIMVDCGSGAHAFGQELMQATDVPKRGHILISHTHWDHIQGFPFFAPLFLPGMEWHVYGPAGIGETLKGVLAGQMQYTYFPVSLENLPATLKFHELVEGTFEIDDVTVHARYLNHPTVTLAYRLEADGSSVSYACDHEPFSRDAAVEEAAISGLDTDHAAFMADSDLIIHDAQYSPAEYQEKVGWGHSTPGYAVRISRLAGAGKLALTHHDPLHLDADIDRILKETKKKELKDKDRFKVVCARDGQVIKLPKRKGKASSPHKNARKKPDVEAAAPFVLVVATAPAQVTAIETALAEDNIRYRVTSSEEQALRELARQPAALLIVDAETQGLDVASLCAQLSSKEFLKFRDTPVLFLGLAEDQEVAKLGFQNWLVEPFSAEYLRTRIRVAVLRHAGQDEAACNCQKNITIMRA